MMVTSGLMRALFVCSVLFQDYIEDLSTGRRPLHLQCQALAARQIFHNELLKLNCTKTVSFSVFFFLSFFRSFFLSVIFSFFLFFLLSLFPSSSLLSPRAHLFVVGMLGFVSFF